MKKFLSAIAGLSVMAAGILAATPAQAIFGYEHTEDDLKDIKTDLNPDGSIDLTTNQTNATNAIANALEISQNVLLNNQGNIANLYTGDVYDTNSAPSGLGTYSKGDCTVDAGCAIKAIGLVNTLKCAGTVSDLKNPYHWYNCIKELDYEKYEKARDCTFGACSQLATLPGQKVVACNNSVNSVLAGNSYLNLPSTLEAQKKELQISWLSQG